MRSQLIWGEELAGYVLGPQHPMGPDRVGNTIALACALGVLDRLEVVAPPALDEALITSVHDPDYVAAVKAGVANDRYGLGTSDNPTFARMHEVAGLIVTATVAAARRVWSTEGRRACNISGGLHHAMPDRASGFCVYNDLAAAITWLLDHGCERVAYVDVDVHHGDGVQAIFYDDPRVTTISLHQSPTCLFPGTGFATETGGPNAVGSAVNVALPPGTDDAGWLRAFDAVVPPVLRAARPQVLITQHGCDTHRSDPLADLELTVDGQRAASLALAALAEELCDGRWLSTGGGGYANPSVVPRSWTHLLAIVSGEPVDVRTPLPSSWLDQLGAGAGPRSMTDRPGSDGAEVPYARFVEGYDPASPLDQSIIATRRAVFPELGLDPDL